MKISFTAQYSDKAPAVGVLVTKDNVLSKSAAALDRKTGGAIKKAIENAGFKGNSTQVLEILAPAKSEIGRIIVAGLGEASEITPKDLEDAAGRIVGKIKSADISSAQLCADKIKGCKIPEEEVAARLGYGALLKCYRFNQYFTKGDKAKKPALKRISIVSGKQRQARGLFGPMEKVADGIFFSRDLVSEPANVLYPESFAKHCKSLEKLGVKVDVLTERRMRSLGMGALLGVGQGSDHESRMVVMEWNGARTKAKAGPLAIVGKGVTFDTGGISIKPASGMEMMKWDMGGAGAVVGLMKALAGRDAKAHVVGIVGLVENMPSGKAQRPGDVVTSMSGQTIEVINTDAEGRLVLADALHYAQSRFKPSAIVDLATLTGAIITALGNEHAGLFSNDDELSERLVSAGEGEGEKLWRFPLSPAYDKMINSQIADMKNIGTGGKAGSITAAQFLKRFIMNDTPWAHLDIAGTAWSDTEKPTVPKGGVGFGVRLLNRLVADHYEK